ncbi:MAG TPA: hypothetical protein VK034_12230 [Enhygromyxa sp.]|nr:hypothetical protein [Enhygromyxa sp.]
MRRPEHAIDDSTIEDRCEGMAEIADEVHERADHSGEIQHDLDDDDDEVWFEAEALAAASTVDLGAGDRLTRSPALEQLARAIASPGISLARLPGWPDAGSAGQGLGALADQLIGELRPGDLVVLGGSERGVGRTSLLAQLGDGLALAHAPERPPTPVLFVTDSAPTLWRARSLARYFDVDARIFVEAERARREPRTAELLDAFGRGEWASLDDRQRFVGREALASAERRSVTIAALRRWQAELGDQLGRAVWPIVVVDPLEHLGGREDPIDTLARLAELAATEGAIVLVSCDLDHADPVRARAIDALASVRLRATTVDEPTLALELCHRRLGPRGRGQLRWHRPSGRFETLE